MEQSEFTAQVSNPSTCVKTEPVDNEYETPRPVLEFWNRSQAATAPSHLTTTSLSENGECVDCCPFCGEEFVVGDYVGHACPGKYDEATRAVVCRCPVCAAAFSSATSWRRHRTCLTCGKLFGSGREYHAHLDCLPQLPLEDVLKRRENLCPNCLRGASYHGRSLDTLEITCTFCGQILKFCNNADLEDHIMNCSLDHNKKEFQYHGGNFSTARGGNEEIQPVTCGDTRAPHLTFSDIHSDDSAPPIKTESIDDAAESDHDHVNHAGRDEAQRPLVVTCRFCEQDLRFYTATECTAHVKACSKAGLRTPSVVTNPCRPRDGVTDSSDAVKIEPSEFTVQDSNPSTCVKTEPVDNEYETHRPVLELWNRSQAATAPSHLTTSFTENVYSRALEPRYVVAEESNPATNIKLEAVDDEMEHHQTEYMNFEMTHDVTSDSCYLDSVEDLPRASVDAGGTGENSERISQGSVKRRKTMNSEEPDNVNQASRPGTDGPIVVTCRFCEQSLRFYTATECTAHVKACAKAGLGGPRELTQAKPENSDLYEPKSTDPVNSRTKSSMNQFQCPHCDRHFAAFESYENHVQKMANGLCPVITCKYCEETMSLCSEKLCTIHIRECRKRNLKRMKRAKGDRRCPHCNRRFTAEDAYQNHVQKMANGLCPVITCKYCTKTRVFCTNQDCTKHILECKEKILKWEAMKGKVELCQEHNESLSKANAADISQQTTTTAVQQSSKTEEQVVTISGQPVADRVLQTTNSGQQVTTIITRRHCSFCFRQFADPAWCKIHVQRRKERPVVINCNYCNQTLAFCTQRDGKRHMIECGGRRSLLSDLGEPIFSGSATVAPNVAESDVTRMSSSSPTIGTNTVQNYEISEKHCPYCSRLFGSVLQRERHVERGNRNPPLWRAITVTNLLLSVYRRMLYDI